jgi:putative holliday junction resolvase
MAICNPSDLKRFLKPGERLLGLDVGSKTIGLALSDTRLTVATPLRTIRRGRFKADAAEVFREAADRGAAALVIGLPIALDASRCGSSPATCSRSRICPWHFGTSGFPPPRWSAP